MEDDPSEDSPVLFGFPDYVRRIFLVFILVCLFFVVPLVISNDIAEGESWMGARRWVVDLLFNPVSVFPAVLVGVLIGILGTALFFFSWAWIVPAEGPVVIQVTGEDLAVWDRESKSIDRLRDLQVKRRTPRQIRYELRG